jgi:hypothetical protein
MITRPPLQKILKGILHTEDENKHHHKRTRSIKPHGNTDKHSENSNKSAAHTQVLKQLNGRNHHIYLNAKHWMFMDSTQHHLTNWIKKKDLAICCLQEAYLFDRSKHCLEVKGWKTMYQANGPQSRQERQYLYRIKWTSNLNYSKEIIKVTSY